MIHARMSDGTILRFPDGTPQAIVDQRAREYAQGLQRQNREGAVVTAAAAEPRVSITPPAQPAPVPEPQMGPELTGRPPIGFTRTGEGQLRFTPPEVTRPELQTGLGSPGSAVLRGVRDLATGVVTAPLDIVGATETAEAVRRNIPQVNVPGRAQEIGAAAAQFGLPAAGAAAAAGRALANAPTLVRGLGEVGAAAVADALASVPGQISTIGTAVGGPTAVTEGDTPVEQRLKAGAEAAVVGGALETVARPLLFLGGTLYRLIRPIVATDTEAQILAERALRDAAVDPDRAIQNLEAAVAESAGSEFSPTTGTASGDPGLIGRERGLVTGAESSPAFAQRRAENLRALSEEVAGVTRQDTGASPAALQSFAQSEAARPVREATEGVARVERLEREAATEVDNLIAETQALGGQAADASQRIDEAFRNELTARTARKNELFDAIDPERNVFIDDLSNLRQGLEAAVSQRGPLDASAAKVQALPVAQRLQAALDAVEEGSGRIAFGDVQDLRPELSAEIAKARAAGEGGVVSRLAALKNAVEKEVEILASSGPSKAAANAQDAINYFRDQFAPLFRQGTGRDIAQAIRRDRPIPGTSVAQRFIRPAAGSREAAQDLTRLIEASAPRANTEAAARDYIMSQLAEVAVTPAGKLSPQNIRRFRNNFSEALAQLPGVQREVNDLLARAMRTTQRQSVMERQLKAAQQGAKRTEREQAQSAAGLFLDGDPVQAVGRVLEGPDPSKGMRELVGLVEQDRSGLARKGLKRALGDYIERRVRANTVTPGGEDFQLVLNRMNSTLKDPKVRSAMRQVYSSREMNALTQVQRRLQMMDRINQQVTAGSATANLSQQAQRARIILASLYGIVRGRGIFAISDFVAKSLGRDPQARANMLIQEAMLDPELAIILLSRDSKRGTERLKTYLANNLGGEFLEEEER